jgi:hypothetical protein
MSLFTLGSARAVLVVAYVFLPISLKFILSLVSRGLGEGGRGVLKVILVGTGVQLKLLKRPNAYIAIK